MQFGVVEGAQVGVELLELADEQLQVAIVGLVESPLLQKFAVFGNVLFADDWERLMQSLQGGLFELRVLGVCRSADEQVRQQDADALGLLHCFINNHVITAVWQIQGFSAGSTGP